MWTNLPGPTLEYLRDLVHKDLQMVELSPSQLEKAVGKTITYSDEWWFDSFDEHDVLNGIKNNMAGVLCGLMEDDGETFKKLKASVVEYIEPSIKKYYEWYRMKRIEDLNTCRTCGD